MKKILATTLSLLFVLSSLVPAQQNTNSSKTNSNTSGTNANARKRPPIFRATKEQIKQAQTLLKQRSLYGGEATGKLDDNTRAALRKYQEAESIKITGTLNAATLEKMSIPLTERQKVVMQATTQKM